MSEPLLVAPLLTGRGLVKHFGRVVALDNCDFDLYPGEILGVIGDNGAGKSTLIKGISGAMTFDAGEVHFDGKPVAFRSPMEARAAGIETVYQNLALSPALSIADNMFLGRELRKPGLVGSLFRMLDHGEMEKRSRDKLSEIGLLTIQNIGQAVETLSGGQRQGVAVARAAAFGSKVIILDEPTAALGVKQSGVVLKYITAAKEAGFGVVFITHNPHHAHMVGDHFVLLNRGRQKLDCTYDDITLEHLTQEMAGGDELEALSHELRGSK
jgi:fructose transport system ATP-binding protein